MPPLPPPTEVERFFTLSLDMLLIASAEGRILKLNPAWEAVLGFTQAEMLGHTFFEFIHPDDQAATLAEAERLLAGATTISFENRYRTKAGAFRWLSWSAGFDSEGGNYYAIARDITHQREIEAALVESRKALGDREREMLELLSHLARQVPGVIYQFRRWPDGRSCFPFASEAIREIYEVSPEEVREDATEVYKLLHPADLEDVVKSILDSEASLEPWVCDYRVILPRQGLRWRRGLARPQRLPDGSTLWHGFISDITEQRKSEEILRASEQKFRVLFEQSSDAHLLFDDTGIIDCNPACIKMLKAQDKAQILNLHPAVLSPEYQPDGERSLDKSVRMDQLARDHGFHRFEWAHRKLDGTVFPVEVTLSPVVLEGKPTLLVVWHDLTEQKQAEKELSAAISLLKTTLDSTADGILVVAKDQSISLFNPQFQEIWGIPKSILEQKDDSRALAHVLSLVVDPDSFLAKVEWLYSHPEESSFDVLNLVDGRVIERYSRPQVAEGKTVGRVWSFRDVTERTALDRLKSEFVSIVSHELRTPLTSIRGSLGLISSGAMGSLSPEANGLLEIACRNSDRLTSLINDLLDSERIESGAIAFKVERIPIGPLLEQALVDNQGLAQFHGIQFALEGGLSGAEVSADRSRLLQVLSNLLSNAAKFSPKGGTVDVSFKREGSFCRISVTDHGEGIPPEFYGRIFQKFSQADSSDTRQKGGTGLGLSITKSIVEKMGGAISFHSEPGKGTTFEFTLRRCPEE